MHIENNSTVAVEIRGDRGELLSLKPLFRNYEAEQGYWDGNWVQTDVNITVPGFRGSYLANLRTEEFADFREQLERLQSALHGEVQFRTMEEWLEIDIRGDGLGHFSLESVARDQSGIGNELKFAFQFDQSYLRQLLLALTEVISKFPVRGQANA